MTFVHLYILVICNLLYSLSFQKGSGKRSRKNREQDLANKFLAKLEREGVTACSAPELYKKVAEEKLNLEESWIQFVPEKDREVSMLQDEIRIEGSKEFLILVCDKFFASFYTW